MVAENKVSQYLLYAIGEIILVVLGILIALQINNRNNFKEQRRVEQEYLISLQSEFETNLDKINRSIDDNQRLILTLENLLTLFDREVLDAVSDQEVSQMIAPILASEISYVPASGVLNDIISSGKLNLILNKNLRNHLASFESSLDFLSTQLNDAEFIDNQLQSIFFRVGSARNIVSDIKLMDFESQSISKNIDNRLIFESVEFENYVLDYLLTARATSGQRLFGGIKTQIETILKEIEQEVED